MNLNEISNVLKASLGIKDSPVGISLFKREEDIPKGIMVSERPLNYCQMVQGARLNGESFLAHADYHKCKGGAAGLGLLECPENISSGTLYFEKLHKCASKKAGCQISANMPRLPSGSTVATYVAPLDKMVFDPDVVIVVGTPLAARRVTQAQMYAKGGRANFSTAGIQSFCVDATATPYLKGEVNISLGCDGSARNANLEDESVVIGIPFDVLKQIVPVLKEHHEEWNAFMRSKPS